jgi:hypothetical protein
MRGKNKNKMNISAKAQKSSFGREKFSINFHLCAFIIFYWKYGSSRMREGGKCYI